MPIEKWTNAEVRGTAFDGAQRPDGKDKIDELIDAVNAGSDGGAASDYASGGKFRATLDATGGLAIGAHEIGADLPDNARILFAGYEVLTTFESAGADAGTIKLGPASDDDGIVVAIAISDGTNPWDAGVHDAIPDWAAANVTDATAAVGKLVATVAVQNLTAGVLVVYGDYAVTG